MRHRKSGRKFSRDTKARAALLRSLAFSLVRDGHVTTTQAKAKELQKLADKLINTAKPQDLNARRQLHAFFGKRDVVNTLVDRYAPALKDKTSGVTTYVVLGNRAGDNATMATVTWATEVTWSGLKNPNPEVHTSKQSSAKQSDTKKNVSKSEKSASKKTSGSAAK